MGQTEKNSVRANVFRFAPKLGHCSMQSACLKGATNGLTHCSRISLFTYLGSHSPRSINQTFLEILRHRSKPPSIKAAGLSASSSSNCPIAEISTPVFRACLARVAIAPIFRLAYARREASVHAGYVNCRGLSVSVL